MATRRLIITRRRKVPMRNGRTCWTTNVIRALTLMRGKRMKIAMTISIEVTRTMSPGMRMDMPVMTDIWMMRQKQLGK